MEKREIQSVVIMSVGALILFGAVAMAGRRRETLAVAQA